MKTLINNTDGYKTYAELREIESPTGSNVLTISTVWDNAKYPGEQVKFKMILNEYSKDILKNMLT